MIKTVLIWSFVALIAILLIIFFITGGGFRGVGDAARSLPSIRDIFSNITSGSSRSFMLPGQEDALNNLGLEIDVEGSFGDGGYTAPDASTIGAPTAEQAYGTASPASGKVFLSAGNASSAHPAEEYLTLSASNSNTAPINVSGWSLQSVFSGKRVYIPLSASPYVLGIVNRVSNTLLPPGGTAVYVSGISPIGVSFQETLCTGYLHQMQSFTPGLSNSCPSGDRVLPYTEQNLAQYGESCFDFLHRLPTCTFPATLPSHLSANCRAMLASTFSYNGCVNTYRSAPDFALNSFRLYGDFTRELWGNDHDTIRLLDGEGRTVDAIQY